MAKKNKKKIEKLKKKREELKDAYEEKRLLEEASKELEKRGRSIKNEVEGEFARESLKKGEKMDLEKVQKGLIESGGEMRKEEAERARRVGEGTGVAKRRLGKLNKRIEELREELGIEERREKERSQREFGPGEGATDAFKEETKKMKSRRRVLTPEQKEMIKEALRLEKKRDELAEKIKRREERENRTKQEKRKIKRAARRKAGDIKRREEESKSWFRKLRERLFGK